MTLNVITVAASYVFTVAGIEAVQLFMGLGQMLEIEFPIEYMSLALPMGFLTLISFAVELILADIVDWNGSDDGDGPSSSATESAA